MRFWDLFWVLFVIVPLTVAWVFAVYDIFARHDLSGWGKAGWFAAVLLLPWIGTFAYLLFRPQMLTVQEVRARAAAQQAYERSLALSHLETIADLHTGGKLTDAEFGLAKEKLLGSNPAAPWSQREPGIPSQSQPH